LSFKIKVHVRRNNTVRNIIIYWLHPSNFYVTSSDNDKTMEKLHNKEHSIIWLATGWMAKVPIPLQFCCSLQEGSWAFTASQSMAEVPRLL
jgi:hypothetical protein